MAGKSARRLEGELASGTYRAENRTLWGEFRKEYEGRMGPPRVSPRTWRTVRDVLNHFERLVHPGRVESIKTTVIDQYIATRQTETGHKKARISPATINRELRHLKAVLRIAHEWGYLPAVPKVRMLKEPKKLPRYVTPEHFASIYKACGATRRPEGFGFSPADYWRALLTFCYMTGWRISEPRALRWDDVSLDKGQALTRFGDNKGGRDDVAPLHPVVVDHLRKLVEGAIGQPMVFPWPHHERTLWVEFAAIQEAAEIDLPCRENHKHTDACHRYGFHDLRRAFATMNAERLSADALQTLMRHKSYLTTKRYVNMARQINAAVEKIHVPAFLESELSAD